MNVENSPLFTSSSPPSPSPALSLSSRHPSLFYQYLPQDIRFFLKSIWSPDLAAEFFTNSLRILHESFPISFSLVFQRVRFEKRWNFYRVFLNKVRLEIFGHEIQTPEIDSRSEIFLFVEAS